MGKDNTWLIYSFLRSHPNNYFSVSYLAERFNNYNYDETATILDELLYEQREIIARKKDNDLCYCFKSEVKLSEKNYTIQKIKQCWLCGTTLENHRYCPQCKVYQPELFDILDKR